MSDSPLSSPDSTPLVSSNDSPFTIDRKLEVGRGEREREREEVGRITVKPV